MHDAIIGERHGVPSVGIMTTEFRSAAELMARVLGAPEHPFVLIEHPISSASPEALAERARSAVAASAAILLAADRGTA